MITASSATEKVLCENKAHLRSEDHAVGEDQEAGHRELHPAEGEENAAVRADHAQRERQERHRDNAPAQADHVVDFGAFPAGTGGFPGCVSFEL